MNAVRVFVKENTVQTGTPYHYYPPAGKPIIHPREIEEEAVLALPLNHPDYVYAILNISSRRPGSRVVEVRQEDLSTTASRKAINLACFPMLRGMELLRQQNGQEQKEVGTP
jgi:hypothetical protein